MLGFKNADVKSEDKDNWTQSSCLMIKLPFLGNISKKLTGPFQIISTNFRYKSDGMLQFLQSRILFSIELQNS